MKFLTKSIIISCKYTCATDSCRAGQVFRFNTFFILRLGAPLIITLLIGGGGGGGGGGSFFFACEDFERMFDNSFPTYAFFFFFLKWSVAHTH